MSIEVFISHAEQDHELAQEIVNTLKKDVAGLDRPGSIVCTSLVGHNFPPATDFLVEIGKIATGSSVQIGIVSDTALSHQYVVAELGAVYWGAGKLPLLLLAPNSDVKSTGLDAGPFKSINATKWDERARVIAEVARLLGRRFTPDMSDICLAAKISYYGEWELLQNAVIQSTAAAGMAAATLYRTRSNEMSKLIQSNPDVKNPSVYVDLEATVVAIQALDGPLNQIATRMGNVPIVYLAEDSIQKSNIRYIRSRIGQVASKIAKDYISFASSSEGFQVLIDGVDGTGSFMRGIPLFCSSVAILIEGIPRLGAIYDPIHHILYSGYLPGPKTNPSVGSVAHAIELATGNRVDLKKLSSTSMDTKLFEEAIGFHLTRSSINELSKYFRQGDGWNCSVLEGLSRASGGLYALNSGLLALADVARGALGGFVNLVTHLWDVAAGQVLIEACGGKVTRVSGDSLDYLLNTKEDAVIDVVAAKSHLYEQLQKIANGSREAWDRSYIRKDGLL
jgi:myo-inositol-1(or 4)-monophosphatase